MATLAQIRNEVARVIGLDSTAAGADETLVDAWTNEAILDILLQTRCYVAVATTPVTANVADYTLDSAILHVVDCYLASSGTTYRLEQVSPQKLLDMRITANSQASSPASHFAVSGSSLLLLYPTPSSADTMSLYYVPRPAPMSSGSHD